MKFDRRFTSPEEHTLPEHFRGRSQDRILLWCVMVVKDGEGRGGCEVELHDRSGSQTVEEAVGMHHCGRQCHHLHVFVDPTRLHDKSISCYCTSYTNNATNRSFGPLKSQLQFVEQSPAWLWPSRQRNGSLSPNDRSIGCLVKKESSNSNCTSYVLFISNTRKHTKLQYSPRSMSDLHASITYTLFQYIYTVLKLINCNQNSF